MKHPITGKTIKAYWTHRKFKNKKFASMYRRTQNLGERFFVLIQVEGKKGAKDQEKVFESWQSAKNHEWERVAV